MLSLQPHAFYQEMHWFCQLCFAQLGENAETLVSLLFRTIQIIGGQLKIINTK